MHRAFILLGIVFATVIAWPLPAGHAATESAAACQPPDENLIKKRGAGYGFAGRASVPDAEKIEQYNAQVRAFNTCSHGLVDGNNDEIERVRNDGNNTIRKLADTANARIRNIEGKIHRAIEGDAPNDAAGRDDVTGFPGPTCRKPDKSLLTPISVRGRASTSISNTGRYYQLQQTYETCVRSYIGSAVSEIKEIADGANSHIREIADSANTRIAALHRESRAMIETATEAAKVEMQSVEGTPLAKFLNEANAVFENGVESVTVEGQKLRRSEDTPTGEGDPDEITCRKPQQLPNSRIPGPEICKRNRVWAGLRKAGLTLSADGQVVDNYERARDGRRMCVKVVIPAGLGSGGVSENEYCF